MKPTPAIKKASPCIMRLTSPHLYLPRLLIIHPPVRWLSNLAEEFFRQGDKERELSLPISPLFDRAKQGVGKSQVGFYDFVALPLVHALCSAFPGTQPLMTCLLGNYHYWKSVEGNAANVVQAAAASKRAAPRSSVRPEAYSSQLPDLERSK